MVVSLAPARPGWIRRLVAWLRPPPALIAPPPRARGTGARPAVTEPATAPDLEPLLAALLGPVPTAAGEVDPPEDATTRVLFSLLAARDTSTSVYRPALARVAELLELGPDDWNGTVAVVTREPAIIAAVLATANSPEFRRGWPVAEIREAIERLGLAQVRQLALALTARALHEPEPAGPGSARSERAQRDLHRALTTAFASGWLAMQRGLARPDLIFVAALFIDVGRPLVYRDLARLEHAAARAPIGDASAERLVDLVHARLGADTLAAWGLPDEVVALCRHHHDDALPAAIDRREWHVVRVVSGLVHVRAGLPITAALCTSVAALALDRHALRALIHSIDEFALRAARLLGVPGEAAAWSATLPA